MEKNIAAKLFDFTVDYSNRIIKNVADKTKESDLWGDISGDEYIELVSISGDDANLNFKKTGEYNLSNHEINGFGIGFTGFDPSKHMLPDGRLKQGRSIILSKEARFSKSNDFVRCFIGDETNKAAYLQAGLITILNCYQGEMFIAREMCKSKNIFHVLYSDLLVRAFLMATRVDFNDGFLEYIKELESERRSQVQFLSLFNEYISRLDAKEYYKISDFSKQYLALFLKNKA